MSTPSPLHRFLELPPGPGSLETWATETGQDSAVEALRALILEQTRIDPGLALEAARRLRATLRSASPRDQAVALRLEAHARRSVGQATRAETLYRRASEAFASAGDREEVARTAIGWMDALALTGRPKEAVEIARRARRAAKDADLRAKLDANLGNVWFTLRRHADAARCYRKARAVFARQGEGWPTAVCDFNLGKIALREGNPTAALRHLDSASEVYRKAGLEAARLEVEVARVSAALMRDGLATARSRLTETHTALLRCGDERAAADALRELAELLRGLGAPRLAVDLAAEGYRAYDRLELPTERAELAYLHGRILADLGHDHDAALQHKRAAQQWESTGNTWAGRRARVEVAMARLRRDDPAGALRALRGVAPYLDRRRRHSGARARWAMARAHLALGRPARAARLARSAWDAASRFPEVADRPDIALTLAQARLAQGERGDAVRWARRGLREFDRRSALAGDAEVRSGVRALRARLYRDAITVVLQSGVRRASHAALDLVLRARSAALMDDLLQREGSGLDADLRRRIGLLRREMEGNEDPGGEDVRFQRVRGELEALEGRLARRPRRTPPAVRALRSTSVLAEWSRRRPDRELVVFHEDQGEWSAFVARPRGPVDVVPLPNARGALERHWVGLRMMIEAASAVPHARRGTFLARTADEANGLLGALREAWLAPLDLGSRDAYFVPTGVLHGIPLEALTVPGGARIRRIPHPALVRHGGSRRDGRALFLRGDTPGVDRETRAVGRVLRRAGLALSTQGTPELSTRGPLAAVHVAAHGVFHPRDWLLSGFRLERGWLGMEHFTVGTLRDSLVFLGSCESGLGRMGPGAELGHWIGAAVLAGVRELVVTLWKVDDDTSVAFAEPFYEAWCAGESAASAAASARARVRESHPHPFNWAPYLAIGD